MNLKELIVHLGMTGSVSVVKEKSDDPYIRAEWELNDGQILLFRDIRRFGRIAVVDPGDYKSLPTLDNIGPEPFDPKLTADSFYASLRCSRPLCLYRLTS